MHVHRALKFELVPQDTVQSTKPNKDVLCESRKLQAISLDTRLH